MRINKIRYTDEDINNLDDYFSKEIEEYKEIEKSLIKENEKYKKILDKIKEIINHYAVEDEDYSKIYNQEEKDILKLLEEIE